MIKKPALRIERLHYYLRRFFQTVLPFGLLICASSCVEVREQVYSTQTAAEPNIYSVVPAAPAVTTLSFTPPVETKTPFPLPTASETPGEPLFANILDEDLPVSKNAYILPLTVRHDTTDSASLFFELDEPTDGYLLYQATSPLNQAVQAVPLTAGENRHWM